MNVLRDSVTSTPEIEEYSTKQGLTLCATSATGIHSSFYVKDVDDKYFVTITQKKDSAATVSGGTLVEVKKQNSILGSSADSIGPTDLFDIKGIFGSCSDEFLAAIRYISTRPLQHTTKSFLFAIVLVDLTKPNLDFITSNLENIILQFQNQ
jgi:hypothetical protein